MNHFAAARFDENVQRLALGLELLDSGRLGRVAHPVSVAFDGVPLPLPPYREPTQFGGFEIDDILPRVDRHDSCLHAIIYRKGLYRLPSPRQPAVVNLRFLSPSRRFVPRRLGFPLLDPVSISAADDANPIAGDPALLGLPNRVRSVTLWSGAAYDVGGAISGLRGRTRRADGKPVRWVRVEAFQDVRGQQGTTLVGRAHGDDRGEFLLLVSTDATDFGPLANSLTVDVWVVVHAAADPPPATLFQRRNDPLWDLPLEVVTTTTRTDPILRGEQLPPSYTVSRKAKVTLPLGRFATSEVPPFIF